MKGGRNRLKIFSQTAFLSTVPQLFVYVASYVVNIGPLRETSSSRPQSITWAPSPRHNVTPVEVRVLSCPGERCLSQRMGKGMEVIWSLAVFGMWLGSGLVATGLFWFLHGHSQLPGWSACTGSTAEA